MVMADLVLKNANVITMDSHQPRAEVVAISGDRISLVGGEEELKSVTSARVIDCQGKTVVPGFNDAHCHIFSFMRTLLGIDLGPSSVRSIADIKAAIRLQAEKTPPGQWIKGTGVNDFYLAEKHCPDRWDLDEVAPHHPVVLAHRSLHACMLNSLALSLAGVTRETPEPPGGIISRNVNTGEPNGILYEMLGYIWEKVVPPLSEDDLTKGFTMANQQYLSYGITSLQEATVTNGLNRWEIYNRFKGSGRLKPRVYMMVGSNNRGQFQEVGLAPGAGDGQLRLGGVKLIVTESSGQLQPSQEELNEEVLSAHRAGFQVAIHAIEEKAVAAAIAALEYAHSQLPQAGRRHRIEHCSECSPPLLERLKRLPAMVVSQPNFVYYSGERYLATVPASRQLWLYRFKSLMDNGIVVAGSSDSPVVPNNPLAGIYAAVTRRTESGHDLLPREGISVEQALAMYTINAAYASFEEKMKGSLSQGKLADMLVLSDDATKPPPERIKDVRVEMTIVGGKVVWEA